MRRAEGLRIALLAAWSGSMITYALFAVRPAFQIGIPSSLAANLLAHDFLGLDRLGMFAAAAALALALPALRGARLTTRLRVLAPLVGGLCHAVSYLWVTPEIETLRALAGGVIGQLPADSSSVDRFAVLHELSQQLYIAGASSALAVLIWDLLAGEPSRGK